MFLTRRIVKLLTLVVEELREARKRQEKILMALADFQAVLQQIRDAGENVAADVETILAQLSAGGLTADEEAQLLVELQGVADRMRGIADIVPDPA